MDKKFKKCFVCDEIYPNYSRISVKSFRCKWCTREFTKKRKALISTNIYARLLYICRLILRRKREFERMQKRKQYEKWRTSNGNMQKWLREGAGLTVYRYKS